MNGTAEEVPETKQSKPRELARRGTRKKTMEETAVTYHFDEIIDRRNTNSLKWDVEEKELPMWVADMDFQTAPEIREAIEKRTANNGSYLTKND